MTATAWTAAELHDELAAYYRKFRGVLAPETIYTVSIWNAIEIAEMYEEDAA